MLHHLVGSISQYQSMDRNQSQTTRMAASFIYSPINHLTWSNPWIRAAFLELMTAERGGRERFSDLRDEREAAVGVRL